MALPFPQYCNIKDKYCLIYLGSSKDYLVQIRLLKKSIESELQGIKIHVCCRDEYIHILGDEDWVLPYSKINSYKDCFAYTKELKCNMVDHPIISLLKESSLPIPKIKIVPQNNNSKKCTIIPDGILPTRSISADSLELIRKRILSLGFTIDYNNYKESEMVVGVESEELFEAAAAGKRTVLIETGIGSEIFRNMFPHCEIWKNY